MKKTMISLATASLIATSAMAADKGIDIDVTGQAAVYYETEATNDSDANDIFDQDASKASLGLQLNLDADLKNGFTFGSQATYLGTSGLEKNLVSGVRQNNNSLGTDTDDQIGLTKIFIAKKIYNTTLKIGRQELPKSLSPFAYSENWSVFKNTFDAILAVNTDIPDTTLVGAYVGGGTNLNDLGTYDNLTVRVNSTSSLEIDGTAYMATVQNKSIPSTTVTATYYDVAKIGTDGASIVWGDVKIANKDFPMGLAFGLQGGSIMVEQSGLDDTTAFGAKIDLKPIDALTLGVAFSSVNDGTVSLENTAPGTSSTPLYTQMSKNDFGISSEGETYLLKATYDTGDYGAITLRGTYTSAGDNNYYTINAENSKDKNDFTDIELLYAVKAGGVNYLAAYMFRSWDNNVVTKDNGVVTSKYDEDQVVRFWARYDF